MKKMMMNMTSELVPHSSAKKFLMVLFQEEPTVVPMKMAISTLSTLRIYIIEAENTYLGNLAE
jgi:hypothetical protein